MKTTIYISLAIIFIALACMVYGFVLLLFPLMDVDLYYNCAAVYRLLFCVGAMYLTFDIAQLRPNSIKVWLLKWFCIYVTGFQFVRLTFNWFVTSVITIYEIGLMLLGFIVTVFLALKHWKNDHSG